MPHEHIPEHRRTARDEVRIPVKIEINEPAERSPKTLFVYAINANRHGMGVTVASGEALPQNTPVTVTLDTDEPLMTYKVPAKLVWRGETRWGLKFDQEFRGIEKILDQLSRGFRQRTGLPRRFYPYVNDEDVDTLNYDFIPYADSMLTEGQKTRDALARLKRGDMPEDAGSRVYAQYAVADAALGRRAVGAAQKAFLRFRSASVQRRRKIIEDVRARIIEDKENILHILAIEGHPRRAAEWEFARVAGLLGEPNLSRWESKLLRELDAAPDGAARMVRRPEGVVCVCPSRNAPGVASLAALLSLLSGNTLVINAPAESAASCVYLWRQIVARVLEAAGAPRGAVNVLTGGAGEWLEECAETPAVRRIYFLGDGEAGRNPARRPSEESGKALFEKSGGDFMIVWKDAAADPAAASLLDGFMGSMQAGRVPKAALVHEDVYDRFMSAFMKKVRGLTFGLPSDLDTILSPVRAIGDYQACLSDALEKGARVLAGAFRANHYGEEDERGAYIAPTVLEATLAGAAHMRCVLEDKYFPLLPVVRAGAVGFSARNRDRNVFRGMINVLDRARSGAGVSVWINDPVYLRKFIEQVHQPGLLRFNSRHAGAMAAAGHFGQENELWLQSSHPQRIDIRTDA